MALKLCGFYCMAGTGEKPTTNWKRLSELVEQAYKGMFFRDGYSLSRSSKEWASIKEWQNNQMLPGEKENQPLHSGTRRRERLLFDQKLSQITKVAKDYNADNILIESHSECFDWSGQRISKQTTIYDPVTQQEMKNRLAKYQNEQVVFEEIDRYEYIPGTDQLMRAEFTKCLNGLKTSQKIIEYNPATGKLLKQVWASYEKGQKSRENIKIYDQTTGQLKNVVSIDYADGQTIYENVRSYNMQTNLLAKWAISRYANNQRVSCMTVEYNPHSGQKMKVTAS